MNIYHQISKEEYDMRVSQWKHLDNWGITSLTGEQDPYALRITCDLSKYGLTLIQQYFGVRSINCYPPWNKGVASIMLPYEMLIPFAIYAMFHADKESAVVYDSHSEAVWPTTDEMLEAYKKHPVDGYKIITNPNKEPGKNKNTHMMSGRTE
jgi:hypothetical protein